MDVLRFGWSRRVFMLVSVLGLAAILAGGAGSALAASPDDFGDASVQHARSSGGAVTTWRILLLIFRQTDTDYVDLSGATRHLSATMPQSDIDALLAAMSGSIAPAVREWSSNQAAWDVEVRYPSQPISSVSSLDARNSWVSPSCISAAITQYFTPGYYDDVMVYWRSSDDAGNAIPSDGWGWASRSYAPNYGYATVTYPGWTLWNPTIADMNTQIWIHEWLHSTSWFYADLGYQMPLYDADGAGPPDYYPDKPPYPGWGTFYAELMNNRVLQGGVYTGIPAEAWARGTIKGPNYTSDQVPPTTIVSGVDDAWHAAPVTLTFLATDNAGGSGMSGGQAKTEYKLDDGPWTAGTSLTVPAPLGMKVTHTVLYRSIDSAGNLEEAKSCTVRIDTTVPPPADTTPPLTTASGFDADWHSAPVTVSFTAVDPAPNASGVAYTEYRLDGGSWTRGSSITVPAPPDTKTIHTIGYRSIDLAGNLEAEQTCEVKIDTTVDPSPLEPPSTSASGYDGAWHRSPVTVSFTALPSVGGLAVAYTEYRLDGGEWTRGTRLTVPASADHSADGLHTISYRSADIAVPANVEDEQTCTVKIDTTGPTIATKKARGSVGRAIALKLCVDDALSPQATAITVVVRNARGTAVMRWAASGTRATGAWMSRGWTPRAKGTYRYYVSARDLAGNAQGKVASAKVIVR